MQILHFSPLVFLGGGGIYCCVYPDFYYCLVRTLSPEETKIQTNKIVGKKVGLELSL